MLTSLKADECLICLEDINSKDKLAICLMCNTGVHIKCFREWVKKDPQHDDKKCLYCQQQNCIRIFNETCLDKIKSCIFVK